jgi:type IX secretion system PorP/SprF family membrane protein
MRNKLFFIILLAGAGYTASAQQDAHFSHYMFNQALYNPAWLTQEKSGYVSALHRTQWAGYATSFDGSGGAPTTQQFNFGMPLATIPGAVGVTAIHDQLGPLTNVHLQFLGAYYKNFNRGRVSIGLRPSLVMQTIDFDQWRFVDPNDPLNKGGRESQLRPDLSFGAMYSNTDFYLGVGINHILSPSFDFGIAQIENRLERSVNLMAGYSFKPTYNLEVSPSILVRSTFKTFTFDASAIATYQNKLWGGLGFRESEAMIVLLGYNFLKDGILKVGYSFDYVIESREAKQSTSHEVFVRYKLGGLTGGGGKKIIRTPRFRF